MAAKSPTEPAADLPCGVPHRTGLGARQRAIARMIDT